MRRKGQEITEGTEEMKSLLAENLGRTGPEGLDETPHPSQGDPPSSSSSLIATRTPPMATTMCVLTDARLPGQCSITATVPPALPADGRPSSRLSHSSWLAQLNTYSRAPAPTLRPWAHAPWVLLPPLAGKHCQPAVLEL